MGELLLIHFFLYTIRKPINTINAISIFMTKKEMIQWLKNEVTMSGSINISLSDAEYERILDKEINMVYQLYPVAVKHQYCVIDKRQFYTPEFKANRTIQFPDCVLAVGRFEEMKRRNTLLGINDADFSFNRVTTFTNKIILQEFYISMIHRKSHFIAIIFKSCIVHFDKSFNNRNIIRIRNLHF